MNFKYFVGIDISKETLDFAVLNGKEIVMQVVEKNTSKGIKKFLTQLKAQVGVCLNEVVFCMEHTGIYNQFLLDILSAKKLSICLEAAVHIKQSMGLQRGKSDKVDALRIAQYAYKSRDELKLWEPKRKVVKLLKTLAGQRSRLLDVKNKLSTAYKETKGFDKDGAKYILQFSERSMAAIEQDFKDVTDKIKEVIEADPELTRLFSIITSVTGIGPVIAVEMIVTTNEFKDINDPAKYACYSGVAPFEHSSGKSVRGRNRVSHKANKKCKTLMHMGALVAMRYNKDMKAYYERKCKEGKNKMLVINNIRNKLIWRIFACVKDNRKYEKNYVHPLVES